MNLPKEFLKDLKYYKVKEKPGVEYKTIFILYFKKWWRFPKKFQFEWEYQGRQGTLMQFRETDEICRFRAQLDARIREMDNTYENRQKSFS
jgi:hypothetical protein